MDEQSVTEQSVTQQQDGDYRIEHDSMGEVRVPAWAKWRAQTQRAVENFPISGTPIERELIGALAAIKGAAAGVNADLGVLDAEIARHASVRWHWVRGHETGAGHGHKALNDRADQLAVAAAAAARAGA